MNRRSFLKTLTASLALPFTPRLPAIPVQPTIPAVSRLMDDGTLYITGEFSSVGGVAMTSITKWTPGAFGHV